MDDRQSNWIVLDTNRRPMRHSAAYDWRRIHSATPQRNALTCRDGCAFLSGEPSSYEGESPGSTSSDDCVGVIVGQNCPLCPFIRGLSTKTMRPAWMNVM
jgi:hypothetical protein